MALIRFAEGQQRSGSIGATTFSHNRFGPYIRARSVPVNPNTDRQVAIRNAVRSLTILWETVLTQGQRNAWDAYAAATVWTNKFGDNVWLTGLNHYVRSNTSLVALGFGRIDTAPGTGGLAAAELLLGCTASEATQQITITFDDTAPWANDAGSFQHFYLGLPQAAGVTFFAGPYKYVVSVAGVTPAVSPKVATSPWTLVAGQRLWLRSRIMEADGKLSEFAQVNFLAGA